MEINKEREAFEKLWTGGNGHLRFFKFDHDACKYLLNGVTDNLPKGDLLSASITLNTAWLFWLGAKKQATPEVLDAPARVGGGVFREGVKWKTVIESAQRLYEHSKDEIKPIVSPADILKIASCELVLVPKDELTTTYFWEGSDYVVNCVSEYEMELEKGEIAELEKWEQTKSTKAFFANIYSDEDNFEIVEFDSIEAAELAIKENKAMIEAQEQSHDEM